MQLNTLKLTLIFFIAGSTFIGCGGGSSSSNTAPSITDIISDTNVTSKIIDNVQDPLVGTALEYQDLFQLIKTNTKATAIVIDAHGIEGLHINCEIQDVQTKQYGLFECDNMPLNIYLGNFKIGTLTKIPKDKIIYTQDVLNLPRAATMHPDVTKISMILQSLDEDADLSNGITITQESMDLLDNELENFSDIEHLTIEDTNNVINNVINNRKITNSNVKLTKVTEKEAQINLTEALANTPAKSLDITSFNSITF